MCARARSPDARIDALRWKLGQATAAWVDASGVNPVLNMLDLVVLATMSRMVVEQEMCPGVRAGGGAAIGDASPARNECVGRGERLDQRRHSDRSCAR